MDKDRLITLIEKFNRNVITQEELILLEHAVEEGKIDLQKFPELTDLNQKLDFELPEPSGKLRATFYQNLAELKICLSYSIAR